MSPNFRQPLERVEDTLQHLTQRDLLLHLYVRGLSPGPMFIYSLEFWIGLLQTFSHTSWFWDCLVIFWGCLTLYECSLLRYSHGFKLQLGFNVILVIMGNYGKMPLIYVVVIGIAVSENPLSL